MVWDNEEEPMSPAEAATALERIRRLLDQHYRWKYKFLFGKVEVVRYDPPGSAHKSDGRASSL